MAMIVAGAGEAVGRAVQALGGHGIGGERALVLVADIVVQVGVEGTAQALEGGRPAASSAGGVAVRAKAGLVHELAGRALRQTGGVEHGEAVLAVQTLGDEGAVAGAAGEGAGSADVLSGGVDEVANWALGQALRHPTLDAARVE